MELENVSIIIIKKLTNAIKNINIMLLVFLCKLNQCTQGLRVPNLNGWPENNHN